MNILALHLYNFSEYAEVRGILKKEILDQANLDSSIFNDPSEMIPSEGFYKAIDFIQKELADTLVGIRAGDFMNLKSLGLIYQISLQTTTVQEALFYLKSYVDSTLPIVKTDTQITEEYAVIELSAVDKRTERIILENILTIVAKELRLMASRDLAIQVFSPFCDTTYPSNWQKGEGYSLQFTNTVLKAALQDRSRWHLDLLVPEYLKMMETLKKENTFTSRIKLCILNLAKPELPDLDQVADAFNMTPRTLQRKLSEENNSFREITTVLKKQISLHLIGHQRFSIHDISYVLGFSEPASFIHSFKKWFGNSPEKFRQKLSY